MTVVPHGPKQYRSKEQIVVLGEDLDLSCYVAWWVDNKLLAAKNEAKNALRLLKDWGITTKRYVIDIDNCEVYEFSS